MLEFSQMLITKACWGKLIDLFVKWLGNYGWAIILLTVVLKLVLSPIDIIQKRMNKKNARMQALMQPELQKVQQQFPNDRNKLNQKQMELSKKYNFNMTGTCLTLLVTMAITITVFTSLFIGIRALSEKQENVAFNEIYQTYIQAEVYTQNPENTQFLNEDLTVEQAINEYISKQVNDKYKQQSKKYSFMWVQNVWKKDTTTSPVVNYSSFKQYALDNGIVDEAGLEDFEKDYNSISNIITEKHKYNGCYILIILAGVITFLSQWLQAKIQKKKSGANAVASSKMMYIIMPLFMIIFASTSSALFTLYIITSSIMTTLISIVSDLIGGKDKDEQVVYKKGKTEVVEYSRNYNKG